MLLRTRRLRLTVLLLLLSLPTGWLRCCVRSEMLGRQLWGLNIQVLCCTAAAGLLKRAAASAAAFFRLQCDLRCQCEKGEQSMAVLE